MNMIMMISLMMTKAKTTKIINNHHHNNDNNDDANIEDTIESITTTKKHARLSTSNRKRTLPPSLTDPSEIDFQNNYEISQVVS